MKKIFTLVSLLLTVAIAFPQLRYLKANLQGSQQVPANASLAGGVVIVKYNTASKFLELQGNYKDLTTAATISHIHSPAAIGSNAGVLFDLTNTGGTTGTLSGTATLTIVQEADLFAGLMYVNIHTSTYPGGEIRGQLSLTAEGQTDYYNGRLQGAQQVPPNASTGSGSVYALVDKVSDSVFLTGNFTGLSMAAEAAHIHNNGAPGANGPVFQNLVFSAAASGTLHVAAPITLANIAQMMGGTTYVNIHNSNNPGGEIRGQLTMLSQARFAKATLQGSQEVPANASVGMGTVIVNYNPDTRLLSLIGDYQNVSAAITAGHIHSPAAPGSNAPVLIPLTTTGGTSGVISGSAILTPAQEADMLNGLMYVNVHNANFPGGEIRGQLTVVTGAGEMLTGTLQGAQQVPANVSAGIGQVYVLLDRAESKVYTTGNFGGLTTPASAGHIHKGAVGVNGPVVVPLSVTKETKGTITGSATVSSGFADSLMMGYTYVNIHNTTFPGGEIRAQLGDLVLPLKLMYFNGYKQGSNISLIWKTTQESNLSRFEIEQMDASGTWKNKGKVMASGGSNAQEYQFTDIPGATSTYALYRLKIVDNTGSFTYSPIIRINFSLLKAGLSMTGNPVTNGVLAFTITGLDREQKAHIRITDYSGKTLFNSTVSSLQNNRINISNMPAGIYRLVVQLDNTTLHETFSKF